jgi:hypothetical protein
VPRARQLYRRGPSSRLAAGARIKEAAAQLAASRLMLAKNADMPLCHEQVPLPLLPLNQPSRQRVQFIPSDSNASTIIRAMMRTSVSQPAPMPNVAESFGAASSQNNSTPESPREHQTNRLHEFCTRLHTISCFVLRASAGTRHATATSLWKRY